MTIQREVVGLYEGWLEVFSKVVRWLRATGGLGTLYRFNNCLPIQSTDMMLLFSSPPNLKCMPYCIYGTMKPDIIVALWSAHSDWMIAAILNFLAILTNQLYSLWITQQSHIVSVHKGRDSWLHIWKWWEKVRYWLTNCLATLWPSYHKSRQRMDCLN